MTTSNRLGITELAETQNNRSVTINEAIAKLEAGATFFAAIQVLLNAPPGSPVEGDLYVVGTAGSGAWSGRSENVALYYNAAWLFFTPIEGMFAWDQTSNSLKRYDGADWVTFSATGATVADADYGDVTVSSSGTAWAIDNDVVTNAKLANMATATFKGRTTAGTGDPEDLTVTQATALLNAVVGDSGSGGTKGLVPAPASGDAAAGKFLKADGTFAVPPGTSGFTAASTTEVLTGTDSSKGVTPDALAALWEKGADVASAGAISLGEGGYFHITGTTTITDIDWATAKDGRPAMLVFDGILTLTHNATTLILPGGANIVTAAGDTAIFVQDASDNVKCVGYFRSSGKPLIPSIVGTPFEMVVAASDESTALTTGTAKVTFRMPCAVTLTAVRASLTTAQTSGSIFTVDINEAGTTVISTKLTIDNTEATSTTAATPAVISDASLADDALMTVDIDQIGDGTAKGLKITLIGTRA